MSTKRTALLGYSGLIGSTLLQTQKFSELYNSSNIQNIRGETFDSLTIAAAPAQKWKANKNSQQDLANIEYLISNLKEVRARDVILISTVDVYPDPLNVDEETAINPLDCHPYGRHRLMLECAVSELFDTTIIRLPGVFGTGLKKNIIYDYLTNNQIDKIDTRCTYQFYNLNLLSKDIALLYGQNIHLCNLTVEPVSVADVAAICINDRSSKHVVSQPIHYDVKSIHSRNDMHQPGYFYSAEQCLEDLSDFVSAWRSDV